MFFDWQEKQRKSAALKLPEEHSLTKLAAPSPKKRRQRAKSSPKLKPIITRGPLSLVWVNPNEPIVIPEQDDRMDE